MLGRTLGRPLPTHDRLAAGGASPPWFLPAREYEPTRLEFSERPKTLTGTGRRAQPLADRSLSMTEANFSTVRQSANSPRSSTALLDETAPSSCPSRRARPRVSRALFRPARSNCACSPISPHDPPAERSDVGVDEGPRAAVRLASFRRARLRTLASFAESSIEDHLDIRLIRDVSPEPLIELGLVSRHDVKLTHARFTVSPSSSPEP